MEVKYAFFRKKYERDVFYVSNDIVDAIEAISISRSKESFAYEYDDDIVKVLYTVSNEKNGTRYLYLSCESSAFKAAKVLDEIKEKITKSDLRKMFFISILRDDVSQYFCERLYVKFSIFERRLRELVFGILTVDLGVEWYDKTIQTELDKDIKEIMKSSNRSKLIQEAMHNMTLSQLETYLFTPYRKVTCEEAIEEILDNKSSFKNLDDLMPIIDSARAQSLWERFFDGKVEIIGLNKRLSEMRTYRNIVAHCKDMSYNSYLYCNRLLRDLTAGIDKAIVALDSSIYKKVSIIETFAVLSETLSEVINSRFEVIFSSFSKMAEELSKIEFPKYKFDFPDTLFESLKGPLIDPDVLRLNFEDETREDKDKEDSINDEDVSDSDEDS